MNKEKFYNILKFEAHGWKSLLNMPVAMWHKT